MTLFSGDDSIVEISFLYEADRFFEQASSNSLGVFDLDETLIVPMDPVFQKPSWKKYADLVSSIKNQVAKEYHDLISNLILFFTDSILLEKDAPQYIQNLQLKNIPIIALTAAMSGRFDEGYLPEMRYKKLKNLGFDFSSSFPDLDHFYISNIKPCCNNFPTYYRGIIYSNGDFLRQKDATSKGAVLCEFLRGIAFKPDRIIFLDDKRYNLEEAAKVIKVFDSDIVFHGLHYVGAGSLASFEVSKEEIELKWQAVVDRAKQVVDCGFLLKNPEALL